MNIGVFKEHKNFINLNETNNRKLGFTCVDNAKLVGKNLFYPNVLIHLNNETTLISPYDEKIMSLNKTNFYDNNFFDIKLNNINNEEFKNIDFPVFFFIYNFDNYYHFLYDTLPHLHTYFYLKKTQPTLKLLINYPNATKKDFYNFNIDILNKFVDINNDLVIHKSNNIYKKLYISTSFTHGGFSNSPPEKEIYELYSLLKNKILVNPHFNSYKHIYISRRTWINNDVSNIGTNYTTRRKMINEDYLVEELQKLGVKEVFAENLSIDEKIHLFNNAELVIGSIGGGMTNLLFSKPTTKSVVIVTPEFLDINTRFKYSMDHTEITYFNEVKTYKENNAIPLFCRVNITTAGNYIDKIGEIIEYNNMTNKYKINISNNDCAGFNNEIMFNNEWFSINEFELLDNGLNSPYVVDIKQLISVIKSRGCDGAEKGRSVLLCKTDPEYGTLVEYSKITEQLLYAITNKTKNIEYNVPIEDVFTIIKTNPNDTYFKFINDYKIQINNDIVLHTKFICHRINTLEELINIPDIFGIEIDIRDDYVNNNLILSHDPFERGVNLDDFLKLYNHGTIILNIKSERTELKCIELMEKYNINDYFFLDSTIPMTYLLNTKYNNLNIAYRFSEFEPVEFYYKIKKFISWIWVDCFTQFPMSYENYDIFKNDNKKICIVSPELQNQKEKIQNYRDEIIKKNIIPDAICCKFNNIIYWI